MRRLGLVLLPLLVLALLAAAVSAAPILTYVGLRASLPVGGLPPFVGVQVGNRLPFGQAFISLILSPDGRSLLIGSADLYFGESFGWTAGAVRLSVGLSYRVGDYLPGLLGGGGLVLGLSNLEGGFRAVVTGEMLFPLSVLPPFFSLEAGWAMW